MGIGIAVNAMVVGMCAIAAGTALRTRGPRASGALSLAAAVAVVSAWPLAMAARGAAGSDRVGTADLSQAWSWIPVLVAAAAVAVAVRLWTARWMAPDLQAQAALLQESLLQSMVAAKMAVELDQPSVAVEVLHGAIATASAERTTSLSWRAGDLPNKAAP